MARISIVVPVFNPGSLLARALDSLLTQTVRDIEIVCVDDGSTDGSAAVLAEYARRDTRIRVLSMDGNQGAFLARKTAVRATTAQYVTFLDPDDELLPNTCELFLKAFESSGADIVHGGMLIRNLNDLPESRIAPVKKMVAPKVSALKGADILKALILDSQINPGLCGKAYRTQCILLANEWLQDGRYRRAQDYMVNFVACALAGRYVSFQDPVYVYGYGAGVFGAAKKEVSYFQKVLTQVDILPPLRQCVADHFSGNQAVSAALEKIHDTLICGSFGQIVRADLTPDEKQNLLSLLREKVGAELLVEFLARRNFLKSGIYARWLASAGAVSRSRPRQIKRIGIFYYHLTPGGVQRVISCQIGIFRSLGIETVLFLEKKIDASCFDLPSDVQIEYLPTVTASNSGEIAERLKVLREALERNSIDLLYYHAFLHPSLLWDLLLCKWSKDIPVVVHYHTATAYRMQSIGETYESWTDYTRLLGLADGVVVLSRADEIFLRGCGVSALYMPNPVPTLGQTSPVVRNPHTIVWCARFSSEKNPAHAVRILAKVRESVGDARLVIVGGGPKCFKDQIDAAVSELKLESCVELAGEQKDVLPYYAGASVYLHTSNLEGFPMSPLEAASVGVPIVMYRLPWLEIVRGNPGIIQVAQGSLDEAAAAVVSVLSSESKASEMRTALLERVEEFCRYDFKSKWATIFDALRSGIWPMSRSEIEEEDFRAMMEQIRHCYARRIIGEQAQKKNLENWKQKLLDENRALRGRIAALDASLSCEKKRRVEQARLAESEKRTARSLSREVAGLKSATAYRVGMFVTWPARRAYRMVKCWQENDLKYTLRRLVLGKGHGKVGRAGA